MNNKQSEITKEYGCLTKHPEGSVRELFTIAVPLMLSILSGNLMMFLDRLILANYSLEAMNAVAAAGMVCMVMQYGAIGIASIAEVFVGQYNGARKFSKAAQPAWQMVWFSVFSIIPFFLVSRFLGPYVLSDYHYNDLGFPYFKWLLYFGPVFPAQAAFSAFFIGLGKVRLVTIATIIGNIVNVILDIILIFGFSNYIPAFGTKGAAIATGIAQCIQILILLFFFLNSFHRSKYNTHYFSFKPKLFWKCIRVGFPSALGHMIEISSWAIIARMLISIGEDYITVMAIGQSFLALIAFGMEGLQKSVTTITANLIGAKKWEKVDKAWKSAVKMLMILAAVFSIIMIIYPDPIIQEFLSGKTSPDDIARLFSILRMISILVWIYFIFDGLTWISAGVLIAAGDTLYVLVINVVSNWFFALLPTYIFIVRLHGTPVQSWIIVNCYGVANAILFYIRYRYGKWKYNNHI